MLLTAEITAKTLSLCLTLPRLRNILEDLISQRPGQKSFHKASRGQQFMLHLPTLFNSKYKSPSARKARLLCSDSSQSSRPLLTES